jgi:hypothetical protein
LGDTPQWQVQVRFGGHTGKHLFIASFSHFDPTRIQTAPKSSGAAVSWCCNSYGLGGDHSSLTLQRFTYSEALEQL